MFPWIAQHFLNPAFFWPAAALVALPIVIHLINRLRYRRVRFAAMEFLLASQQRNRRRILLEQLLLLLLRILIVVLIGLLIARLILDPSQLSFLQGSKSHHVVLLDDSGSMRERQGDGTAFDAAKAVIQRLVTEGARRPGTQTLTVLRLSQPQSTFANLGERDIDQSLVEEVTGRLEGLTPTHGRVDLLDGLEAARQRLVDDRAAARYLHVVSDFRHRDWIGQSAVGKLLADLQEAEIAVNLVRTVGEAHQNLAVTDLSGAVEVAAAGVPIQLTATIQNFGSREANDVRLQVSADGERLPLNLVFDAIAAGQSAERRFEVEFPQAGRHRVEVSLESDALEADNTRYLAVDVPQENAVLIVDGAPGDDQGLYVADALGADRSVTGYAPLIVGVEGLRRADLGPYQSVYLLNVSELPPDALDALERFVSSGGGLVWFLGNSVQPAFYNEVLYRDGRGLFPVKLSAVPNELERFQSGTTRPDLLVGDHPMFSILGGQDNPFIDVVLVNTYIPPEREWLNETGLEASGARVIATLRNRDPLMLEHRYGEGTVITSLTSAGPLPGPDGKAWNNWASGPGAPSYAVMILELQRYIARGDRTLPRRTVGEPIVERLDREFYREDVELQLPDERVLTVKAAPPEDEPEPGAGAIWTAAFGETDLPGVYRVRRFDHDGQPAEHWMAYNVPTEESELTLAGDDEIRRQVSAGSAAGAGAGAGAGMEITIQPAGVLDWIRSESPGQDVRWGLLAGLLLLFVLEQGLAYRLGYHQAEGRG